MSAGGRGGRGGGAGLVRSGDRTKKRLEGRASITDGE